jgi:hypothetical protein
VHTTQDLDRFRDEKEVKLPALKIGKVDGPCFPSPAVVWKKSTCKEKDLLGLVVEGLLQSREVVDWHSLTLLKEVWLCPLPISSVDCFSSTIFKEYISTQMGSFKYRSLFIFVKHSLGLSSISISSGISSISSLSLGRTAPMLSGELDFSCAREWMRTISSTN